jgi:hypothetical protein
VKTGLFTSWFFCSPSAEEFGANQVSAGRGRLPYFNQKKELQFWTSLFEGYP